MHSTFSFYSHCKIFQYCNASQSLSWRWFSSFSQRLSSHSKNSACLSALFQFLLHLPGSIPQFNVGNSTEFKSWFLRNRTTRKSCCYLDNIYQHDNKYHHFIGRMIFEIYQKCKSVRNSGRSKKENKQKLKVLKIELSASINQSIRPMIYQERH